MRQAPEIARREGLAEDLPYQASSFDAVVSQFGLEFFDDRQRALQEMWRVLRAAGSRSRSEPTSRPRPASRR